MPVQYAFDARAMRLVATIIKAKCKHASGDPHHCVLFIVSLFTVLVPLPRIADSRSCCASRRLKGLVADSVNISPPPRRVGQTLLQLVGAISDPLSCYPSHVSAKPKLRGQCDASALCSQGWCDVSAMTIRRCMRCAMSQPLSSQLRSAQVAIWQPLPLPLSLPSEASASNGFSLRGRLGPER